VELSSATRPRLEEPSLATELKPVVPSLAAELALPSLAAELALPSWVVA
jgi:hypothetical protein